MFNQLIFRIFISFFILSLIPFPSNAAESKTPASPAKPADSGDAKEDLLDINTATKAQLMTLPGIGEDDARKIIEGRPYKTKLELTERKIIPGTTYKAIIYKIVAKQKK